MFIQYLLARDRQLLRLKCHKQAQGALHCALLKNCLAHPDQLLRPERSSVWDSCDTLLMPPTF